ncbi:MAG: hypothetical protein ACT4OS_09600 [Acidimicrobiales bacterium]
MSRRPPLPALLVTWLVAVLLWVSGAMAVDQPTRANPRSVDALALDSKLSDPAVRLNAHERRDGSWAERSPKHRFVLFAIPAALYLFLLTWSRRASAARFARPPHSLGWTPETGRGPPPFQLLIV